MLSENFQYRAKAQVDAVAACPLLNGQSTSNTSDNENGDSTFIAMAYSSLEGNQWGGGVALIDSNTQETLCEFQTASGISSIAWCGLERDFLACACDNGDIQLLRVSTDVDFSFVPQTIGNVATEPTASSSPSSSSSSPSAAGTASNGSSGVSFVDGHDDVVTGISASILEKTHFATCSWDLT
jgi:hypothetical protein